MTPPAPRRAGDEAAERIISLLWLLLSAPQGLERDRIRRQVVGYEGLTDTAFEKLFQRDRRVLRAVGVPLETLEPAGFDEGEAGVRHRVVRDALRKAQKTGIGQLTLRGREPTAAARVFLNVLREELQQRAV